MPVTQDMEYAFGHVKSAPVLVAHMRTMRIFAHNSTLELDGDNYYTYLHTYATQRYVRDRAVGLRESAQVQGNICQRVCAPVIAFASRALAARFVVLFISKDPTSFIRFICFEL